MKITLDLFEANLKWCEEMLAAFRTVSRVRVIFYARMGKIPHGSLP